MFKLRNNDVILSLTNKHVTLIYDGVFKAIDGVVIGVTMRPLPIEHINYG